MVEPEIIIIPDVHGRTFWREALPYIRNGTPVIFLGDYLDPYEHEGITKLQAIDNFKEILEATKDRPNVHLLIGNHDCTYIWPNAQICECRTDYDNLEYIHKIFRDNLNLFSLFYIQGNVLCTHAGVHPRWLDGFKGTKIYGDCSNIERTLQIMDNLVHRDEPDMLGALREVGHIRGGWSPAGSCVWADIREFAGEDMRPIGYQQIVGHTQQLIQQRTPGGFIWVGGEPVRVGDPGLDITCLDCHQCFYLDSEGDIRFLKNDNLIF